MNVRTFSPRGVKAWLARRRAAAALVVVLLPLAAATPAAAQLFGGGSSDNQRSQAEMSMRINQLEGQLRQMNGQIEQMGYQVKQLNDLIARMQKDYEFRLQDLENGGARKPAAPAGGQPMRKSEAPLGDDPNATGRMAPMPPQTASVAAPIGAAGRPGPGAPPAALGTLSNADPIGGVIGDGPMDLSATASRRASPEATDDADAPPGVRLGPAAPSRAAPRPSDPAPRAASLGQPVPAAGDQYDAAYAYMLNGEYALAESSFKAFLADHPTDKRAASGQYWLGESYYSRKMYREAADAFLTSYQQYPSSPKAPDSLLKLGLALNGLGEKKAACASFDELLAKYPKASKALRDLAGAEKNKARCG